MTDGAITQKRTALIAVLEGAGYAMGDYPILMEADSLLDLVGPHTRGRLFLTTGIGGREFCLRPEFTISIARAHIRSGAAARQARYGYCGPVFRKRPSGTGEFLQAGAESLGRTDRAEADADMVLLAWEVCGALGVVPQTVFGDDALFKAVLASLDLPAVWHRRLQAAFGDRERLDAALADLEAGASNPQAPLSGLGRLAPDTVAEIVGEMISASATSVIAGRRVSDIAARFADKSRLQDHGNGVAGAVATVRDYLAIDCPIDQAVDRIRAFATAHGLDLSAELDGFSKRHALIAARRDAPQDQRFQAGFGRQLDYYTGFTFDIFDAARAHAGPVCGGGRYDGLAERLGAETAVPAVGFSLWLDRLLGEAAA
ncbi:MAG: ATP phosphoribosyltransferase regulatory subunit [Pseudomonadota bacterium]